MDIYNSLFRPEITANDAGFFQVPFAAHIVWSNQSDCTGATALWPPQIP